MVRVNKKVTSVLWLCVILSLRTLGSNGELVQPENPSAALTQRPLPPIDAVDDVPQAFPEEEKENLPVFTMDYPRIQVPFEITLWVLLASFSKIGFHVYHKITIWIPESCLLISIGLIVGAIMHSVHEEPPAVLESNVFFLYMLPPIVLESGYFMPTRPFFENAGTVLWYAVIGSLWNSIGIGLSLYGICQIEAFGVQDINLQENLLFASIISAVDPVAVLNVFEDISVNEQLFIVIFGEGLFNDAVTVVLYNMFTFVADMPVVDSVDVFLGVARFFVVGLGGIMFGFLFGLAAAFTTRFTSNVWQIEPLFVLMYSYLAYLVAELFGISSIMAIVMCALTMRYYVEANVCQRSCTTIRHVIKMLASISETLIFFFLGVVTITMEHEWNWGYILFTLVFAFIWRGLGILVLSQIINPFRTIPFNYKDQFGLAYGGLRGAICFALVFLLPENIGRRKLFLTDSIVVILFTVFIQGISIRPLVEYLVNIRRTHKMETINVEIHSRVMEHTIAGIEDLCGQWSHHYWKDKFKKFNDKIIRRILLRDNRAESSIVALYKRLELQNAIELLDAPLGDISAAPSVISLYEEKASQKASKKPKRKFLAADIQNMHDILSKNMYKIRQRTMAYTNKNTLGNNLQAREILIRRHSSVRRSIRPGSFRDPSMSKSQKYFSLPAGQSLERAFPVTALRNGDHETASEMGYPSTRPKLGPPHRYSSRGPMSRRLDTLREAAASDSSSRPSSVDFLNERGGSRPPSRSASRQGPAVQKAPVPTPRRRSTGGRHHSQDEEGPENEDGLELQPLAPPPGGREEPQDPFWGEVRNPLLRRHPSDPDNTRRF
ncbi:sodium/hydrogen exchanger 2-like [Chanos chanos]|uniref:Sodium/hydrogen exchanger n=1 Tax=Chanos chanos TaxID=29144 RepID=A0A6J2VX30_CHACN|nr:sodium/hydrogen exchanger 2-like [Chanos chanos]